MEKLAARAALVPAPGVGEGIATSVSRSEIEEVLASEGEPIQLVLDVKRFSDGEGSESHTVAVSWERSDLERVLEEAPGDQVVLTFDGEALRQAVEGDVEAHGLRELAVTLAVAATAATGVAQATAAPDPGGPVGAGVAGVAITQTSGPDDRAVSRAAPVATPQLASDDRAVTRAAPTPAPQLGVDDRTVPRATPIEAPAPGVAPDDRAVPRAVTPIDTPALAPDDRAAPRATPIEAPAPGVAPDDRAVPRAVTPIDTPALAPDDRAVPRAGAPIDIPAAGTASDPGPSWAPSPAQTIVLAGGIALAIAGAFFLVGDRRVRPRPI
ncbi:MAG TPA: hypothetical protein VNB86_03745 [Gaiellaceae bacterium]|jgi:hypothetical protein|nr:hypothetical protein [Gaiellaceae bacterium]